MDRQQLLDIAPDEVIDLASFTLRSEGVTAGVEVALVDDAEIAELHERFLGVEGPTDVITFPLHEDGDPDPGLDPGEGESPVSLGEVVVSTETACRQAPEFSRDPRHEVLLYVVHGVLHLLGYDDLEEAPREEMEARQARILDEWLAG